MLKHDEKMKRKISKWKRACYLVVTIIWRGGGTGKEYNRGLSTQAYRSI